VKEALAEIGTESSVEKVPDTMAIASYGEFGTPAVVIDGEVKNVDKIPKKEEALTWVKK